MLRKLRRMLLTAVAVAFATTALADKVDEISGEFTYYGKADESPAQCLLKAEEHAIAEALRNKYGTIVTQSLVQTDRMHDGRETNDFMMLSASEVNGQWLGHTSTPEKRVEMDSEGNIVATVKVKGRASRIGSGNTQYEAVVMRNGTDRERFASTQFKDGDTLYAYFSAPVDGYLSIFLADEQNNVFKIFPYTTSPGGEAKMKGGYEYVLFDEQRPESGFGTPDGMVITGGDGVEYNKIYTIFSPQSYSLPPLRNGGSVDGLVLPQMTDYATFTKWLSRLRATDGKLGVKLVNLTIGG